MNIRLWMLAAILACSLANVYGQRIQVVDQKGNGIALVSVTTIDGNLIGTTDIEGVLSNVKGHQKVGLNHLAYQPKMVTVSELKDGKVTLLDLDYNIAEIVVKPKQYITTSPRLLSSPNSTSTSRPTIVFISS